LPGKRIIWEPVPEACLDIMIDPASEKAAGGSESNEPSEVPAKKTAPDESDLVKRARDGDMSAYDDLVKKD